MESQRVKKTKRNDSNESQTEPAKKKRKVTTKPLEGWTLIGVNQSEDFEAVKTQYKALGMEVRIYDGKNVLVKETKEEKRERQADYRKRYRDLPHVQEKIKKQKEDPKIRQMRSEHAKDPKVKERKSLQSKVKRQELRRLHEEHPEIAEKIKKESEEQVRNDEERKRKEKEEKKKRDVESTPSEKDIESEQSSSTSDEDSVN